MKKIFLIPIFLVLIAIAVICKTTINSLPETSSTSTQSSFPITEQNPLIQNSNSENQGNVIQQPDQSTKQTSVSNTDSPTDQAQTDYLKAETNAVKESDKQFQKNLDNIQNIQSNQATFTPPPTTKPLPAPPKTYYVPAQQLPTPVSQPDYSGACSSSVASKLPECNP